MWTLRWEWVFYLIFGWLIKLKSLSSFLKFILLCSLTWIVFSSGPIQEFVRQNPFFKNGANFLTDFSAFFVSGFGVGILAAILKKNTQLTTIFSSLPATVMSYVLPLLFILNPISIHNLHFSSLFLALPFIIIINSKSSAWAWLELRPLQILGHISYGIYLYHGLVLYLLFKTLNQFTPVAELNPTVFWAWVSLSSISTLFIAFFSYKHFELRFLKI